MGLLPGRASPPDLLMDSMIITSRYKINLGPVRQVALSAALIF
jgi:hypothetical protein